MSKTEAEDLREMVTMLIKELEKIWADEKDDTWMDGVRFMAESVTMWIDTIEGVKK